MKKTIQACCFRPALLKAILLAMMVCVGIRGGTQNWNWAYHGGGDSPDNINGLVMSNDQRIFFGLTAISNPIVLGNNSYTINGIMDMFLLKLDNNGNELSINQIGGPFWPNSQPLRYDAISSLEYDPISNCIYVYGSYVGPCDFGGITLNSSDQDIFIAKYDQEGNCLWAKRMGGSGMDRPYSMAVDKYGNLNLCAFFPYTGSFGNINVSYGGHIARYDPEGNCLWAKQIFQIEQPGDLPNYFLLSAKSCNESVYFSGYGGGDITIDTITFPTAGYAGQFIAKFNLMGDIQWVNLFGGPVRGNILTEFDFDNLENIYITASFCGEYGTCGNDTMYSSAERELFMMKLNSEGEQLWLKQGHANGFAKGYGTNIGSDGFLYVTGNFAGSLLFGDKIITSETDNDLFILKMDSEGNYLNSLNTGGIEGQYVIGDNSGSVIIAGSLVDTAWIGGTQIIGEPYGDIFVGQCILTENQSIPDNAKTDRLLIYANPSTGICNISIPEELQNEENLWLLVYDNAGKLILQKEINMQEEKISLNLQAEAKGVYNAILNNGKQKYQGRVVFE